MREVVVDTETTGLDVAEGHRLVSIGCVEVQDGRISGNEKEWLINPQRAIPEEAMAVHGLTNEALADKPTFSALAEEVMAFLGDAQLVMHNAPFDMSFLNAALRDCQLPTIGSGRVVDTLVLARRLFPSEPASLDALCRRYDVSLRERQKHHGALLDARLLAKVYCLMAFGDQAELGLAVDRRKTADTEARQPEQRAFKLQQPTQQEQEAHSHMLSNLQESLWENADV
ncbi:MAG: DNA polymerase III subunit epsilon [Alphaproteobacteria bacterium GM202ARS2]|nr:DNA polymerase III subunit epsilon [Alphaproteobacteria bacterium GM202ARS2]